MAVASRRCLMIGAPDNAAVCMVAFLPGLDGLYGPLSLFRQAACAKVQPGLFF